MSRILEIADRLERDIVRRKMKPGDPYLATAEVAQRLQVSSTLANRSLQVLVQRRVIERKQGRGACIAPEFGHAEANDIDCVHLLVRSDYLKNEGLLADGLVVGLQQAIPSAQVRFDFIPDNDDGEYVEGLVNEALSSPVRSAFVLARSSLRAQRRLEASQLPTVILGSRFPSVTRLPFINRDNAAIGERLAKYLLDAGRKQIAVMMRHRMWPGDWIMLDGVQRVMAAHGMPMSALTVRFLPDDETAIAEEFGTIVRNFGIDGAICRSVVLAQGVYRWASSTKRRVPRDLSIVVCDYFRKPGFQPQFPYAREELSPDEQGQLIGRWLVAQARGEEIENSTMIVPIRIVEPIK